MLASWSGGSKGAQVTVCVSPWAWTLREASQVKEECEAASVGSELRDAHAGFPIRPVFVAGPQTSYLILLYLSFSIYKMKIPMTSSSQSYEKYIC